MIEQKELLLSLPLVDFSGPKTIIIFIVSSREGGK